MSSQAQIFIFTDFRGGVLGYNAARLVSLFNSKGITAHIFKDLGQRLFLDGGDAFDNMEALSTHVSTLAAEAELNITIGASGGGYMALRQAAETQFSHCLLMSPITAFDSAATFLDPRGKRIVPDLHSLEPVDEKRDAAHVLKQNTYAGSVHLFFPKRSRGDVFHARNLSLYDRINLHPQDSRMHMFHADGGQTLPGCLNIFAQHEGVAALLEEPQPTVVEVRKTA